MTPEQEQAIRERDAQWEWQRCQHQHVFKNGRVEARCGNSESMHRYYQPKGKEHEFQYDPAEDTSAEADRRALLAELDRLR